MSLSPSQREVFRDLRECYGPRYNRGETQPWGGYVGPMHWQNTLRWINSAQGVLVACETLLPGLSLPQLTYLELGCGPGVMVDALRSFGAKAFGLDLGAGIASPWAVQGNAVEIPFGEVNVVVALDVLEHVPGDLQAELLGELRRVARHLVLATVPTVGPFRRLTSADGPVHHYLTLSPMDWRAHFEAGGFDVIASGRQLSDLGVPWAWGAENYPFALRKKAA
jgi:hypothetical protein